MYRWILYAYCPLHLATLAGVCHLIWCVHRGCVRPGYRAAWHPDATGLASCPTVRVPARPPAAPRSTVPGVSALAFLGATLSAGVAGGILFTAAHELLHGSSWVDRACAHAMLAAVGYMHWTEGHLAHHVKARCGLHGAGWRPRLP